MTAWQEKVALVTGGASGIGRATALAFGGLGAKVVVADVDATGGEQTVKMLRSAGAEAQFIATDVSRSADVEAMMMKLMKAHGRLDCAFNNAGIEGALGSTVDCSEENWDRTVAINLKGVWLSMKHQIPLMLETQRGAIVNCSSVAGLVAEPHLPAYNAAKHGVVGLTKCAAIEYATRGIRVNAVCPGIIDTPMVERVAGLVEGLDERLPRVQPVGRMGRAEEIARAVVWLCSDEASFVTGTVMPVDGGWTAQ